jgi:hypothetical protein
MTVQAHRKEPRATVEMDPNERQVRAGRLLPLGPSSSLRRPPSNIVRALRSVPSLPVRGTYPTTPLSSLTTCCSITRRSVVLYCPNVTNSSRNSLHPNLGGSFCGQAWGTFSPGFGITIATSFGSALSTFNRLQCQFFTRQRCGSQLRAACADERTLILSWGEWQHPTPQRRHG